MKQKIFKTKILDKLEDDIIVNQEHYLHMEEDPTWLKKQFEESENNNYEVDWKNEIIKIH